MNIVRLPPWQQELTITGTYQREYLFPERSRSSSTSRSSVRVANHFFEQSGAILLPQTTLRVTSCMRGSSSTARASCPKANSHDRSSKFGVMRSGMPANGSGRARKTDVVFFPGGQGRVGGNTRLLVLLLFVIVTVVPVLLGAPVPVVVALVVVVCCCCCWCWFGCRCGGSGGYALLRNFLEGYNCNTASSKCLQHV